MDTLKRSRRKTGRVGHHRHGFDQFYDDIIQFELDTGLVDCLVSRLVLTIEDADKIRGLTDQTSRNKRLLSILKGRPYNSFSIFTEALNQTDPIYSDLVKEMKAFEVEHVKCPEEVIEIDDFCVRFQKSYKTLVDQISSPIKLVDILFEREIFNREDSEDVSSINTVFQQNRKLLSKIGRKGRVGYEGFLRAMKMSEDVQDQELACDVENTEIIQDDRLLLQIGITLSQENEQIPSNVKEIVQQLADQWKEEGEAFVETRGTMKVYNTIKESNVITIVGSSGSGKTAVMRHVVLKLKSMEIFQIIPVESPDKILEYRNSNTKQIFLIDDVLGTYSISPIQVEKWERLDNQIQQCLNKTPGFMKLVFTLRKQLAYNQKFCNCSSIVTQNVVDLEDDQFALSTEEKKQILTKHLKIKNMESSVTEDDLKEACTSRYAFPLLCKIISSDNKRLRNISKFFREPFSVLEVELNNLWTENKEVYCSLVFCMLLNGRIERDFFDLNLKKRKMFSIVTEACGLDSNVSRKIIEDSLTSVVGSYIRRENGIFYFIHDAFFESISSNFAKRNPDVMFTCCSINLILDRVRINSRLPDDDENVIVIVQDQFEVIAKRILTECEEGRFSKVLLSQLIKNEDFVEYFGTKLSSRTSISSLMRKISVERHVNKRTVYYFVKSVFLSVFASCLCKVCTSNQTDNKRQNKINVNNAALKRVIRAPPRQSTFIHWILASGCHSLFTYFWRNASQKEIKNLLSRDWKCPLTKPFFPLAVHGGNIDIIRKLYLSGADVNCFSDEGETPLSITARSGRDDIATVLVDWGADVNQPDIFSHRFPSFICVENENMEVLKLLLKNNCDVNLVDIYGRSSTMLQALLTRKRMIVMVMLDFDSKDHPLHSAILNGDVDGFTTNLGNEHINSQTRNGFTPLHYATQVNGIVMIKTLLRDRANEEPSDHFAGSSKKEQLIPSMMVKINAKNKNGLTPLHLAVLNDHVEAVRLLVERNADVNVKDHFGRTPLHYSQNQTISSLLLISEMSKSTVAYSTKSCSVVPVNQSAEVVVDMEEDQEDYHQTLPWGTVFRNVSWFFLPFKKCIFRGAINQLDNHQNTPLHLIVETAHYVQDVYDVSGNINVLVKHGANIHLCNDEGKVPCHLIYSSKYSEYYRIMFSPFLKCYRSKINRRRDSIYRVFLFLISLMVCFALVLAPLTSAVTHIANENNITNMFLDSNSSDMDALKRIEQKVDDLLMYYVFLVGSVFLAMAGIVAISSMIRLWKTNGRYGIACLIFTPIIHCCAVTLFIVKDKPFTFTGFRFMCVILVLLVNGSNFCFVNSIQELLSKKIKLLQNTFLVHFSMSLALSVITVLAFLEAPLDKTYYSSDEICNEVTVGNLSLIMKEHDITTYSVITTSLNCTQNTSTRETDYTSFNYTLVYITCITFSIYIFQWFCTRLWTQLQNTYSRYFRIYILYFEYYNNISQTTLFNALIVLFIMLMYSSQMSGILGAIYSW